jgi:hypothetical protein
MVGVKEGIVNENAMRHGGRDMVALLNQQFPIMATGGTLEDARRPDLAPQFSPPVSAGPGAVQGYPDEGAVMEDVATPPQFASAQGYQGLLEKLKENIPPKIVQKAAEKAVQVSASPEMALASERQRQAFVAGDIPKANANNKRFLKLAETAKKKADADPAFVAHQNALISNFRNLVNNETDEVLAAYGLTDVVAARNAAKEASFKKDSLAQQVKEWSEGADGRSANIELARANADAARANAEYTRLVKDEAKKAASSTADRKIDIEALKAYVDFWGVKGGAWNKDGIWNQEAIKAIDGMTSGQFSRNLALLGSQGQDPTTVNYQSWVQKTPGSAGAKLFGAIPIPFMGATAPTYAPETRNLATGAAIGQQAGPTAPQKPNTSAPASDALSELRRKAGLSQP